MVLIFRRAQSIMLLDPVTKIVAAHFTPDIFGMCRSGTGIRLYFSYQIKQFDKKSISNVFA